MKRRWLIILCTACGVVGACGDKESGNNANSMTDNGATFCLAGTADCGCDLNRRCTDEGYLCVDGTCVACPEGAEGCACNTDGSCDGDLSCVNPNPDCTFSCDPATCQQGGNTCGPQQLCERTIGECMENLTQDSCEGWYDEPSNCTDMPAYTACNCECVQEDTCEAYFACGNNCFNDHCN